MKVFSVTSLRHILGKAAFAAVLGSVLYTAPAYAVCSNNMSGVAGRAGEIEYFTTTNRLMYCDNTNWIEMRAPTPVVNSTGGGGPTGCPSIGNTCSDGSIYVGLSPDGNVPMYMTTVAHQIMSTYGGFAETGNPVCDAGGTDPSCRTGAANTTALAALGTVQTVPRHCNNLVAHGNDDWYLPAREEMRVLFQMHNAVGSDLTTAADEWWWSSSESTNTGHVWTVNRDGNSVWPNGWKGNTFASRCVRKVVPVLGINNSVIGHWKFDELTGTSAANSISGGPAATLTNSPVWRPGNGIIKGALDLNGTNQYATTTSIFASNHAAVSASAWFKADSWGNANSGVILALHNGTQDHFQIRLLNNSGQLGIRAYMHAGTNGGEANSHNRINLGQWYHVVVTYDSAGTRIPRIFLNGVEVAAYDLTVASAGTHSYNGLTLRVGADGAINRFFDGLIDDVRVYNRILSAANITELYAMGPPVPIARWRLDETSGTAVADSAGYALNGTMQGTLNGGTDSVAGQNGTALNFNGTSDYINIPHNAVMNVPNRLTVAAWVRSTAITGDNHRIVSKWGPSGNMFNLQYNAFDYGSDGQSRQAGFEVRVGTTNYLVDADNNVARMGDGQWHHLVGVYDGSTISIYTDGVLRNSTAVSGALTNYNTNINIGRDANNYGFFPGDIDDVKYFNRSLSADEVRSLYGDACRRAGDYYYDSSTHSYRWCNGFTAINMGSPNLGGGGTCTVGELNYNTGNNTYFYCNSSFQVPIGRSCTECGGAANKKVAFISAKGTGGSMGGIAGVDARCQSEANAAGLSGTYLGWIADSTAASAPATRFSAAIRGGAYSIVRPDGAVIANNWADLIDGTINTNIITTAFGAPINSNVESNIYGNVATNGTRFSATDHCSNYTSISGNVMRGDARTSDNRWTQRASGGCSNGGHVYCFEQ